MADKNINLSQAEIERREKMLNAEPMGILFTIALPLIFYNSIGQVFQYIDTLIAGQIGASVVSSVSFVMQIEKMLQAIGTGLAIGGGVLIGRSFGSGDMKKVKSLISTIFVISVAIGIVLLVSGGLLMKPWLKLFNMQKSLLDNPATVWYARIVVASIVFQFINTIYFAIQKSRGNTKVIMWGNLLVIFVKTALNAVTITLIKSETVDISYGIYMLPCATLIAHLSLNVIALCSLFSPSNPFRVSLKDCTFTKAFARDLSGLSIPVFLEKFIFAAGKAIVNGLCGDYHNAANPVGALGVSDRICAFATNPVTGVQEAESSLVSNNIGNKNIKRAISFFKYSLIISISYVAVVFVITYIFKDGIISGFVKEGDEGFANEIRQIFDLERYDNFLIAINASVMGLLYGFGKTKVTMVLNIIRLFGYRIPSLLLLTRLTGFGAQDLHFLGMTFSGLETIGLAMLISNSLVGITGGIVAVRFIIRTRRDLERVA